MVTPNIEQEIRRLCADGIRGQCIDEYRAAHLQRKYPQDYARIHEEEKRRAFEELNPLSKS